MARKPRELPTRSRVVPALLRYVRNRGGNADGFVGWFQLPEDAEALDEVPITLTAYGQLLDAVAKDLREPFLGLRLPEALEWPTYALDELAALASATLRDALAVTIRFAALAGERDALALEERDGEVTFTQRTLGYPRGVSRHAHEYALAQVVAQGRQRTGLPLAPKRVWFIHPRPSRIDALHAFFGTAEIDFGRLDNGLAFDPQQLDAPQRTADPRLRATAERLAEAALQNRAPVDDLAARVAARVREALAGGNPQAEEIARQLHMSARTLQRRLEAEGTRFTDVLDRVRADLAQSYLKDGDLPLAEIAYRLGFSDFSTFSRAFKRWTGQAPGAYRLGG